MDDILSILDATKSGNVAEQIYVKLKKMLFAYEIVPGQKLQCQDLAEKFRVSRTPVKDALNKLEKEGYVLLKHNRGYYVAEIGLGEAEELYDIREALETVAVRKAIENLTTENLKAVKEAMDAYAGDVSRGVLSRKRLILDASYHLAIAGASGNRTLVEMLRTIFSKIYLKHKVETLPPERGYKAGSEHKEIYGAICSKEVPEAIKKMKRHIALGRKNVLRSLGNEEDDYEMGSVKTNQTGLRIHDFIKEGSVDGR
jgi:DNA-binding GntR family transcriptional regulator